MLNMQRLSRIAIIIGVFSLPPLISGNAKNQLQPEFPDVGKVFEGFRAGLALFDIDNDGDLDCVTATQQDYNASVPSVTYVWHLQPLNGHEARNIYFYVRPGDGPGQILFKDKNECMLWISWEANNNVPQRCTDEYEDKCEDAKQAFDEETCSPYMKVS
ncbi:uncharacterized protein LOC142572780 isoform X2 [Dermacentor variabilis]|uniref:uncharacterized protein LOC142572780 isoform X2 n=1 Tax=Dermacentor variabilis TaxID=34621 RepID=UPI003F5BAB4B